MLQSQRICPTLSATYFGDNRYISIVLGFDLNGESINFSVGISDVNTLGEPTSVATTELDLDFQIVQITQFENVLLIKHQKD